MTEIKVPDRQPDIEFENAPPYIDEPDMIVRYWIGEGIREIIHLDYSPQKRTIEDGIDTHKIYEFNKQFEKIGHMTDSGCLLFLKGYENYLIEKELLS